MRDYGKISPQFWIGDTGRQITAAGKDARILASYLLTCPASNMIGLYYLPITAAAQETGLSRNACEKAFQQLKAIGFAAWDAASQTVFVTEMAAHQIGEPLKEKDLRCKGVLREWSAMRMSPFFKAFHARYRLSYHLPRMGQTRSSEGPSKPHRSQEQEQEQLPIQGGANPDSYLSEGTSGAEIIHLDGRTGR